MASEIHPNRALATGVFKLYNWSEVERLPEKETQKREDAYWRLSTQCRDHL